MTTPADEMPLVSKANVNSLSEKLPSKIEGNHNIQASSSFRRVNTQISTFNRVKKVLKKKNL